MFDALVFKDAESNREVNTTALYDYYQYLMTRVGAYKVLAEILEENNQTGAVISDNCDKPNL